MKKISIFFLFLVSIFIFAPQLVFAEEYTTSLYTNFYNSDSRQNALSNVMGLAYHTGTAQTSLNAQWSTNYYYTDLLSVSNYRGGVLKIPFYSIFYPQSQSFIVNDSELAEYCQRYTCNSYDSNGVCLTYNCSTASSSDYSTNQTFYDNYSPNASFNFRFYYNDSSHWTPCNLEGNNIVCPIPQDASTMYNITVFHKIIGKSAFTYYLALGRGIFVYTNGTSAIVEAQENTTQAIDDMNTSINNSDTTESSSTASNFFSGFQTESNGHLTQIITAPLTLLSSLTASCTTPVEINLGFKNLNEKTTADGGSLQVGNKTIMLPCGTALFWENSELVEDISSFRTFWNILIGGPIIYGLLLLVMSAFNNAIDPLNDELITLEFNSPREQVYRDMRSQEVRETASISHNAGLKASDYKRSWRFNRKR